MSAWPDFRPRPLAAALLHWPTSHDGPFVLDHATWPNLELSSLLPLHIIKVCAVGIHRDELELTKEEKADKDFVCKSPGYEFSGYVVSTSPYSPLRPGTAVYGRTSFKRFGNALTYTVARFHELAPKPKSMSWEEAATVPIGGLVAYQALFDYPLLREPGPQDWDPPTWNQGPNQHENILITGAATPAGIWAVQLAKRAGVGIVTATCDAGNMDMARRLGADEVLDWTQEGSLRDWHRPRFSTILDCMGGRTLGRAWGLVAPAGKIISVAEDAGAARPADADPSIRHFTFTLQNCPKHLNILAALADRSLAQPVCDARDVFYLEDFHGAFQTLAHHPRGHVVLKLESDYPGDVIAELEEHGENRWDTHDFGTHRMRLASEEGGEEPFAFAGWLATEGSNRPDLATPRELMPPPPPPVPKPRSRLELGAASRSFRQFAHD